MAYSADSDVRLHAPQAPDGEEFTGYIEQADRIIDANLRATFDVPFSTVPDLVVNISSKLAAAIYLKAKYSALNQEPSKAAMALYDDAMKELMDIVSNPNLLDVDLKAETVEDDKRSAVIVSSNEDGVFNMGPETGWG